MGERGGDHALKVKPAELEQTAAGGGERWGRIKRKVKVKLARRLKVKSCRWWREVGERWERARAWKDEARHLNTLEACQLE